MCDVRSGTPRSKFFASDRQTTEQEYKLETFFDVLSYVHMLRWFSSNNRIGESDYRMVAIDSIANNLPKLQMLNTLNIR